VLLIFSSTNTRLLDFIGKFCEAIVQADSPRLGYTATRIVLLVGEIILARLAVCMLEGAVSFFFLCLDRWLIG
jgi:hypothetical protein